MQSLVTGSAGFIGFHLAKALLAKGERVVGIDGMTPYYDPSLKRRRHAMLREFPGFRAEEFLLEDADRLRGLVAGLDIDVVYHLAAQAGVRYSLENPRAYMDANLTGTFNLLDALRWRPARHLILASTSSVYGANEKMPFQESDRADRPLTLYAATKKATEEIAHCYAHLWAMPATVVRFFSVYGPWGRPDMALYKFTRCILNDEPIELYNSGDMRRDFTYVDDLVEAILQLTSCIPNNRPRTDISSARGTSPVAPFRVVNIGNSRPVELLAFVEAIERSIGRPAKRVHLPMQPGDVPETFADTSLLRELTGFRPSTSIHEGVEAFVRWYRDYHSI